MPQIHTEPGFEPSACSLLNVHLGERFLGPYGPIRPILPDVLWASTQLRNGGPGHRSDWPKVTNEDLARASKTTLQLGQTQSAPELKQAVLNCGDKSAAPGLPRTPLTCPWLTAAWRLTGWGRGHSSPVTTAQQPSILLGPCSVRQVRASGAGRHPQSGSHPRTPPTLPHGPLWQADSSTHTWRPGRDLKVPSSLGCS